MRHSPLKLLTAFALVLLPVSAPRIPSPHVPITLRQKSRMLDQPIGLADSAWPAHQHDNQRTGRSNFVGITSTVGIAWRRELPTGISDGGLTLDADGKIYTRGVRQTDVFDSNGNHLSTIPIGGDCASDPTFASNGNIYLGGQFEFYGLSPDHHGLWKYLLSNGCLQSSAAISNSVVYATMDGTLRAMDALTGTLNWSYPLGIRGVSGFPEGTPAIGSDGTVYVGDHDLGGLFALKPDGTLKWNSSVARYNPAVDTRTETIYAGGWNGKGALTAFQEDGSIKWAFQTDDVLCTFTSPALSIDGTIFFGAARNGLAHLYALNPDGTLKWRYPLATANGLCTSPITDSQGNVYFCADSGRCYGVDANGSLLWAIFIADGIWLRTSPVIAADSVMYVAGGLGTQQDPVFLYKLVPLRQLTAGLSKNLFVPLLTRPAPTVRNR